MTSFAIYGVDLALISISLSFVRVCCACDDGYTSLSCPGQWWKSWYIWVFIGSLLAVISIVGLRFLCQRYGCSCCCCGRQMMLHQSHRHRSQIRSPDNDESRCENGISAYCIPLPPEYDSCSSSPPPYQVIFSETNKDRRPSPAELRVPQGLPSYEEFVSNKSRIPTSVEEERRSVEASEFSRQVSMYSTD